MELIEKTISSERVYNGKIVKLRVDEVELPDGRRTKREVCDHQGGVGILPIDSDGCAILVRQYRYPYETTLLEIPAGKLEPGEDPLECGVRELKEETGCTAEKFTSLGVIYPTAGYVNEKLYLYLAQGLSSGQACPDEGEFLKVERIPFDELVQLVMEDKIHDAKTVAAALKAARIMGCAR